jgi:hypothetical protein
MMPANEGYMEVERKRREIRIRSLIKVSAAATGISMNI